MNELCWVSLQVPDVERARTFWRDVVGLKERSVSASWVELELREGILLALHPVYRQQAMEKRGYDRGGPVLGIAVKDLDEMRELLARHSANPLGKINAVPGGRSQDFEDPDGYVFELVERAGAS